MALKPIVPNTPPGFDLLPQVTPSRVACLYRSALQAWDRIKISRAGEYSTTRTAALDQYCRAFPLRRVFAVCTLTPSGALLLGVLTELIPLQDPAAGWRVNIGAWLRFGVFTCSAALGFLFQIRGVAPELSYRKIFLIVLGTGCGTISTLIVLSALWAFPLPFGIVLISIPFQAFFVTSVLISIRQEESSVIPHISGALKQRIYLILAQSGLVFVYVTFSVIFAKCSRQQQFGLLLFLPVMKLVFKHLIAWLASDNTETIPLVVVFTVDLFNGLYVSICLQSSRSWLTSLLMIGLNVGQTLLFFWEIGRDTKEVLTSDSSVIETFRQEIRSGDNFELNKYQSVNLFRATIVKNQVAPSDSKPFTNPAQKPGLSFAKTASKLDRNCRKMLFRLEYLVLIKYIESVTPTVYVLYLVVVYSLPSAKYYPHTRSLSLVDLRTNIESIMMYASAQMISLLWLHIVLKRRLGVSLLYQLAFVLENEMELAQGRLFVWIMPLLQITLVHFGTRVNCTMLR